MPNIDFKCFNSYINSGDSVKRHNAYVIMNVIKKYYSYLNSEKKMIVKRPCHSYTAIDVGAKDTLVLKLGSIDLLYTGLDCSNPADYALVTTFLAHEFAHVYYGDIYYSDNKNFSKRAKALNVLKETRADIFANNLVLKLYGVPNFNWILSDKKSYQSTGYLDAQRRKKLVSMFPVYNKDVVSYICSIFRKDNFIDWSDLIDENEDKNLKVSEWVLHLLCK